MDRHASRFMVLLIDFDQREDRLNAIMDSVPERLRKRVFILGTWSEPERLRQSLGAPYEAIGLELARERCSSPAL
ncbi:MAG: hypothetical protein C5B50_04950 [Verrucomicrobia bacterium]|nr:MAG: hypothetical protein C5B50_04950 [Verrucomicrobiota bacterium]